MSYANMRNAIHEYAKVGAHSGVEAADPHRLIQMLMEGALDKVAAARGHMGRNQIAEKGVSISWAISIIDGLRVSLDMQTGGELVENLHALYLYMMERLLEANVKNDPALLDEVAALINEIKGAWDTIPLEARKLAKAAV